MNTILRLSLFFLQKPGAFLCQYKSFIMLFPWCLGLWECFGCKANDLVWAELFCCSSGEQTHSGWEKKITKRSKLLILIFFALCLF